jgi:hypothetical protein
MATNPVVTDELTYCAVHPDRETALRCNKCDRYMCAECAVQTPVGYRCKQCVRQHEDKFFNATDTDLIVVFAACAVLAGVGAVIVQYIGFIFLILLLSLPVGGGIAEIALRLTQRRRGRYSGHIGAAGVVVGGIIGVMAQTLIAVWPLLSDPRVAQQGGIATGDLLQIAFSGVMDISVLLFIGIAAFAVYGRFRMKL